MRLRHQWTPIVVLVLIAAAFAADTAKGKPATINGYVLDSACAFTKNLDKPVSRKCAEDCAKGGSPLVILTKEGDIYWPISEGVPSKGQNAKLLPFAGQKVTATGEVFERGGSHALVIHKIAAQQ